MIPESKEVAYECENGHVNTEHSLNMAKEEGKQAICKVCGGLLTRKLVPMYQCNTCEHVWAYTGSAKRVTCPNCAGKNTKPVSDSGDT